jgi:3-hydroxyacyl-CoA dehydrogenase
MPRNYCIIGKELEPCYFSIVEKYLFLNPSILINTDVKSSIGWISERGKYVDIAARDIKLEAAHERLEAKHKI